MVERGRAVYDIFLSKGVTLKSKNLVKEISRIEKKNRRKVALKVNEKYLLKVCQEINVKSRTVRRWLKVISADPYIIEIEIRLL